MAKLLIVDDLKEIHDMLDLLFSAQGIALEHAFDFLTKPYGARRALTVIELALQERQKRRLQSINPPSQEQKAGFDALTNELRETIKCFQERESMLAHREENVREKEHMIRDRQQFLATSEASVDRKLRELLAKEAELEQMLEDINTMSKRSA